ncbi:tetratricopeptide repeat protein [Nitrospira sp. M1]
MKRFAFLITIWIGLFAVPTHCWADIEAGNRAYYRGDYKTALEEFRPLAEAGNMAAQSILGGMYYKGEGIPKDLVQAKQWFHLAANQGNAYAQEYLSRIYYFGEGVPKDLVQAVKWLRLAADQGDHQAQHNLGVAYFNGEILPRDYVLAYMWLNLAASHGSKPTIAKRNMLEKKMSPAQIAEGQRLSREWKPKVH